MSLLLSSPASAETLPGKFQDPDITAAGERRARVPLRQLETLWINTGSLCNITCVNCYIESSPSNDRLVYLSAAEVRQYLEEAKNMGAREIGFTGGEPFLNSELPDMLADTLGLGFSALVLTNAMQPMLRPKVKSRLMELNRQYRHALTLRVSLDHYTKALHEAERGSNTWTKTLEGIGWLIENGFKVAIAGRTCWGETEAEARAGYAEMFAAQRWPLDASDPDVTVLFPEMDGLHDVAEISEACWTLHGIDPSTMMCASTRMVVKRKGASAPAVVPCTLLPYAPEFEMGETLSTARKADGGMFDQGAIKLCHSHCAKFCVLGGGSCS
ncbi:MAG: radical SAM protein [Hyphomicrobiaceae bacterium]|nr:radical SAM protein [Hyphomicrobiaceae bacterium]